MEIRLLIEKGQPFIDSQSWDDLLSLLKQEKSIVATVKRVTIKSLVLKIATRNWEFPLNKLGAEQGKQFSVDDQVQLELLAPDRLLIRKIDHILLPENQRETSLIPSSLQEALHELGVLANPATEAVAKALLESGFALREQLIWLLVPWEQRGLLESAILLLQAKFPLNLELMEAVENYKERSTSEALLENIGDELSPELQKSLAKPTWENRGKLSSKSQDLKVVQSLMKLTVEESFVQGLFKRASLETEFVFALPFLLESDLHTSWVRIKQDQQNKGDEQEQRFRFDLLIPTRSYGLVETELVVWGKNLAIRIWMEKDHSYLGEDQLDLLEQELREQGWNLGSFNVLKGPRKGGFGHAKSSCFAL